MAKKTFNQVCDDLTAAINERQKPLDLEQLKKLETTVQFCVRMLNSHHGKKEYSLQIIARD